jgi:hypothetical protein
MKYLPLFPSPNFGEKNFPERKLMNICFRLPLQPVNATHALNRSAGVSKYNVSLGRSFN